MNRRTFLATASTSALATTAGCSGDGGSEASTPTDSPTPTNSPTPTDSPTPTESPTPTPTPTPGPYDVDYARENAREPSYDDLFRNIEEYKGDPVRFEYGQIYQVIYDDAYDYIQMNVSNNDDQWEGDIAGEWHGEGRYLENDYLNPVIGVVEQLYEYETVQGDQRTVPYLTFVEMEVYEEPNSG